ncbi:MAG: sialate O-acetylesterase [Armatimonadota bacterium]|nr:sialate O-acetylesterase [bacterium]
MRASKITAIMLLLLLGIVATVHADVIILKDRDTWKVTAREYEAVISSDGCMTSLKADGSEFLCTGIGGSRGAYFVTDQTLRLPDIQQDAQDTITASGTEAEATWRFADDSIKLKVTNKADKDMWYRMVIDPNVRFVNTGDGKYTMHPVKVTPISNCTWVVGSSALNIKGGTKLWGPWVGETMTWELLMRGIQTQVIDISFSKPDDHARAAMANARAGKTVDYDGFPIFSPDEARVFQRQSRYAGWVVISGRADIDCDSVEYRITGKPLKGSMSGRWQRVRLDPVTRGYSDRIKVPAGGWYSLDVRALKGKKVILQKSVSKFGVGEVFVGAGQSNSTSCGQYPTQQASGMVSCYTGTDWQIRNDPFIGSHDGSILGSVYPNFGDAMYKKYHVPIGIASTGHGGTSVTQWNTGGELFNWTMDRIHYLGPGGFRAVMWHQGEADCGMPSEEYFFRMSKLINDCNRIAGWNIPWFVAQASYADPDHASFPLVREGQRRLWESKVALEGPDTDKLTKEYRDFGGIGVHFNPKGLKVFAEMWFEKISSYIDAVLVD